MAVTVPTAARATTMSTRIQVSDPPDELEPLPEGWVTSKLNDECVSRKAITNSTVWVIMLATVTSTPELTATDTARPRRWK